MTIIDKPLVLYTVVIENINSLVLELEIDICIQ